jgi:TRAP-type mannitol/chloroaromatic compound transport system substrate-binding protein
MKRIATAAALAVAAAFSLGAAAQTAAQPKSVKVQSTWPASLTIQDHLRILSDRVDKLTSGQVKI